MDGDGKKTHVNDERVVRCPAEDCDKEVVARGIHLHVSRSVGDGHGPQGDVPDSLDFDDLETVGSQSVEMQYPEHRNSETAARLCPYCEQPFRGKHGVIIHLGQVKGRKNHPEDAVERHEPEDFAIVKLDENENIIEEVEPANVGELPTDHEAEPDRVKEYIETLREEGRDKEADRAERMLLDT